ncbi:MAG: putative quinol monooxygenase [Sarcina sp.]
MISIIAKCIVKEDKIEDFKVLAKELVYKTKEEFGCVSYDLCVDSNKNNLLVFIEKWNDETCLDSHHKSQHFKELVPKLRLLQEADSQVTIYKNL